MDLAQNKSLITNYINAYNEFDIQGMLACLHDGIKFRNISDGEETVASEGIGTFQQLAEQGMQVFTSRQQSIENISETEDRVIVQIAYRGMLAVDLPNGIKAGETLELNSHSQFTFLNGKISEITDIS